jgi:hypothetical protein
VGDFEDKTIHAIVTDGGRPRAQLHHLKSRLGTLRVTEGTEEEPKIIERITAFGNCEVWKYVSGRGTRAWFEMANWGG